jgi:hypothetical protein
MGDIEQNITHTDQSTLIFTGKDKIFKNKVILSCRTIFVFLITCSYVIMSTQEQHLTSSKFYLTFVVCSYINWYKHYERLIRDKKLVNTTVSKHFYYNLLWYNSFPFNIIKLTFIVDIVVGVYLFVNFYNTCGLYQNYIISCATIVVLAYGIIGGYCCKMFLFTLGYVHMFICNKCGKCYCCNFLNCYFAVSVSNLYVTFAGDDELFISQENNLKNECIICFEEECVGDIWRTLDCGHIYHSKCVDPWIENNGTCPNCRKEII